MKKKLVLKKKAAKKMSPAQAKVAYQKECRALLHDMIGRVCDIADGSKNNSEYWNCVFHVTTECIADMKFVLGKPASLKQCQ